MQKLKEMIEKEQEALIAECETIGVTASSMTFARKLIIKNNPLKNQIIEILQESGDCLFLEKATERCNVVRGYNYPSTKYEMCSWCQGQEKINKLLEG